MVPLIFIIAFSIPVFGQVHTFKPLPYSYNSLEPHIDAMTVEIHYDRHHRGYFNNFMQAIKGTELEQTSIETILKNMSKYSETIRNNGGGWYNHDLYWEIMIPGGPSKPSGKLLQDIEKQFGSFDRMIEQINAAAMQRFGSGWAWLIVTYDGKLAITSTPNQDNPLMDIAPLQGYPILGIDVWEHAYYLKYQNRRADYVQNFWKLVNWSVVEKKYLEALSKIGK